VVYLPVQSAVGMLPQLSSAAQYGSPLTSELSLREVTPFAAYPLASGDPAGPQPPPHMEAQQCNLKSS